MITASNTSFNTYYIQKETRNFSFLKMHTQLVKLGVKNNKFFLRVYDRRIIDMDIDPFNPRNKNEAAIVFRECLKNPWYYLRELARVTVPGGTKPFELHRGNLAILWCMFNCINSYTELPRQNYKTMSVAGGLSWIYNFGTRNSKMMLINKKLENANDTLDKIKCFIMELPDYLQFDKMFKEDGTFTEKKDNVRKLTHLKNGNQIETKPSATTEGHGDTLGRGCTHPIQYFDEPAFMKFIYKIYPSAAPAFSQASREAKDNEKPYCKVFTSTPGDLSTKDGMYVFKNLIGQAANFTEELYDYTEQELFDFIKSKSSNDFLYIKFTYKQLGRDEEYYREQCRALLNVQSDIDREVLLKWGISSDNSPFDTEHLNVLRDMQIDEDKCSKKEMLNKYHTLRYFTEAMVNFEPVIISVDVASGTGNDESAIEIIHARTKEQLAEFHCNKIGLRDLAALITTISMKVFPVSVIAIERNNAGVGVIEFLLGTEVEAKIYKDKRKDDTILKYDKKGYLEQEMIRRKMFGITTSPKNRPLYFDLLREDIIKYPERIKSPDLVKDICGLVKTRTGKVEAGPTTHDDTVMAYSIGRYVLEFATDLHSYGIDTFMTKSEREDFMSSSYDQTILTNIENMNDDISMDDFDSMYEDTSFGSSFGGDFGGGYNPNKQQHHPADANDFRENLNKMVYQDYYNKKNNNDGTVQLDMGLFDDFND